MDTKSARNKTNNNNILLPKQFTKGSDTDAVEISDLIARFNSFNHYRTSSHNKYISQQPILRQSITKLSISLDNNTHLASSTNSSKTDKTNMDKANPSTTKDERKRMIERLTQNINALRSNLNKSSSYDSTSNDANDDSVHFDVNNDSKSKMNDINNTKPIIIAHSRSKSKSKTYGQRYKYDTYRKHKVCNPFSKRIPTI